MKKLTLAAGLTVLISSCGMLGSESDSNMLPDAMTLSPEAMMERQMSFAATGFAHDILAGYNGMWNVESQVWMEPDAEPIAMNLTAQSSAILGGLFRVETVGGLIDMPDGNGQTMQLPFGGQMTMGFNNATEEWWSIWIDNFGSSYSDATGKTQADGTVRLDGMMRDFRTPNGRPYHMINYPPAADGSLLVEMFDTTPDGIEWKTMEMTYTRP